jgi:hypothetical protein
MLGGGADRSWLEPLTLEGNKRTDNPELEGMVGCHTGRYIGLNIKGAQPGFEYIWERNDAPSMMQAQQKGGQVVKDGDPEMSAFRAVGYEDSNFTPPDSREVYKDVVLVRYPSERIRAIREQEQRKAKAMMREGARDYADRADAFETELSGGRPTRFRRDDHSLQSEDVNGRPVDYWSPDNVDKG